jgi:hypothetical protein
MPHSDDYKPSAFLRGHIRAFDGQWRETRSVFTLCGAALQSELHAAK